MSAHSREILSSSGSLENTSAFNSFAQSSVYSATALKASRLPSSLSEVSA